MKVSLGISNLFQHTKTIQEWNINSKYLFKSIIPRVFLYDEMTTDGYGMCVIELMTLHGILLKTNNNNNTRWTLADKW